MGIEDRVRSARQLLFAKAERCAAMPAARIPLLAAYAMWYGVIFCSGGCGGAHLVLNLIRHHGDGEARGSGGADSGLRDHGDRGLEGGGRGEAESEGEHAEHLGLEVVEVRRGCQAPQRCVKENRAYAEGIGGVTPENKADPRRRRTLPEMHHPGAATAAGPVGPEGTHTNTPG